MSVKCNCEKTKPEFECECDTTCECGISCECDKTCKCKRKKKKAIANNKLVVASLVLAGLTIGVIYTIKHFSKTFDDLDLFDSDDYLGV